MARLLRFFSLTTATQVCLLVNQLVLLPLLLRSWGQEATADWFVVLAIANLATIGDLGLRNAGHSDLLSGAKYGDADGSARFRRVWALTRFLFVTVTAGCIVAQWGFAAAAKNELFPWVAAITVSMGLDTLLIVRGMWLDTLGHFNKVEVIFLGMVVVRLVASFTAILGFGATPATLAWIMFATSIIALAVQSRLFADLPMLSFTAGGFYDIQKQNFSIIPLVLMEPAANWARLSLPVLVLSVISAPMFVTTYVALRAVFGLARQVINQVARYVSVAYVQRLAANPDGAEKIASRGILGSSLMGVAISACAIADNGRLLQVWLHGVNPKAAGPIVFSFAIGACAYGYQVLLSILIRRGRVSSVAYRQIAYLILSGVGAGGAMFAKSTIDYLIIVALQELFIAALFSYSLGGRIFGVFAGAFILSAVPITLLEFAIHLSISFNTKTVSDWIFSMLVAGSSTGVSLVTLAVLDTISTRIRGGYNAYLLRRRA